MEFSKTVTSVLFQPLEFAEGSMWRFVTGGMVVDGTADGKGGKGREGLLQITLPLGIAWCRHVRRHSGRTRVVPQYRTGGMGVDAVMHTVALENIAVVAML